MKNAVTELLRSHSEKQANKFNEIRNDIETFYYKLNAFEIELMEMKSLMSERIDDQMKKLEKL